MDQLLLWDHQLFLWMNGLEIPVFDGMSPFYRHKLFWIPGYVFLLTYMIRNFGRSGAIAIAFAFLTIGFSDTASSQWVKKSVKRVRPCNTEVLEAKMNLRIRCGVGYSFTSSHATNHAAVASFFFFVLANVRHRWHWLLPLWAVSIALAQVYVGVHFPSDVIVGLLLGAMIGWVTSTVCSRYFPLTPSLDLDPIDV